MNRDLDRICSWVICYYYGRMSLNPLLKVPTEYKDIQNVYLQKRRKTTPSKHIACWNPLYRRERPRFPEYE